MEENKAASDIQDVTGKPPEAHHYVSIKFKNKGFFFEGHHYVSAELEKLIEANDVKALEVLEKLVDAKASVIEIIEEKEVNNGAN